MNLRRNYGKKEKPIIVTEKLLSTLKSIGKYGETLEDIIWRLYEFYIKSKKKN